jgi:hypothetical protein
MVGNPAFRVLGRRDDLRAAGALLLALAIALLGAGSQRALLLATYEGVLYAPGTDRREVLFHVMAWKSEDGGHLTTRFRDPDGTLLTSENLWLNDGQFERYTIEHHRAGRSGEILRDGDRLRFRWSADGRVETREEPFRPPLLVPAGLVSWIQAHWPALVRGERLRVRLGVPYARRTIGFELARHVEPEAAQEPGVVIRMAPTSFLIRRIVRPIELAFTPDGAAVQEVSGRAPALRATGEGWQRTEAEGVYRKLAP